MSNTKSLKKTILLVDDDVIVRIVIAKNLRSCGFGVIEAAGAAEGKIVLQDGPPVDLAILDARSGDGGFALAQWIRRYRKAVGVILTSTLANKVDAVAKLCPESENSGELFRSLQNRRRRLAAASVPIDVVRRATRR